MFVFDPHVQKFSEKFAKRLPKDWFAFNVVITGQIFKERPDETATAVVCSDPGMPLVNATLMLHHAVGMAKANNLDIDSMVREVKQAHGL